MVLTNLSVESLMSMTSWAKPLTVSHRAVTPLTAMPPMKLPNALALAWAFWNAFTALSELPVMRTDMTALLAISHTSSSCSSCSRRRISSPVPQSISLASLLHCHGVPPKRWERANESRPRLPSGQASRPS